MKTIEKFKDAISKQQQAITQTKSEYADLIIQQRMIEERIKSHEISIEKMLTTLQMLQNAVEELTKEEQVSTTPAESKPETHEETQETMTDITE